jgi:hypothetical protein
VNAATGGPSAADGAGRQDGRDGRDGVFDGTQDLAAGLGSGGADDGDGTDGWDAEDWAEEDAELSRLVRPYTLTRGRTRHAEGAAFDVIAQVVAVDRTGLAEPDGADGADDPEHQAILALVRERPLSVAELAAGTDLPLGVVRILLGDLLDAELIQVSRPVPTAELPDTTVLREVIRGLRAL